MNALKRNIISITRVSVSDYHRTPVLQVVIFTQEAQYMMFAGNLIVLPSRFDNPLRVLMPDLETCFVSCSIVIFIR